MKKQRFVIIDGNALIHRAFHAFPPTLTTKKGEVVNAVYGFTVILLKVLKDLKPDYIAATFDLAGPTFRHKDFADYKGTRVKAAQELYDQIPRVKEVVTAFNIPIFEKKGFEADDLIGTVTKKLLGKAIESYIVTGDMDTLQLVDEQTKVFTSRKGLTDTTIYDEDAVVARYGLKPEQLIDYKALRGDPSDNIPGVKGIGEKTASELLQKFVTLEALYDAVKNHPKKLDDVKPRIVELLREHEKEAYLSKHLATIVRDVPIDFALSDAAAHDFKRSDVVDLFQELEFKSLLAKLPTTSLFSAPRNEKVVPKPRHKHKGNYNLVNDDAAFDTLLAKLHKATTLSVDTETTSVQPVEAELLGISVAWKSGEAYYLNLHQEKKGAWLEKLRPILESHRIKKTGHNLKYDYAVLKCAGIELAPLSFDSMIASYLLNPGTRQHSLDALAFAEFGYEMQPITELIGPKGKDQKTLADVPLEDLSWYSCEDADFALRLKEKLEPEVTKGFAHRVMSTIEMPLVSVLASMEIAGVKIDVPFLKKTAKEFAANLAKLEKAIYKEAGKEFNINSPAQMKEILFDALKVSTEGIGKTKSGFSTAADELEKLKDKHPIVPKLMEYREVAKLLSTYLEALPELVSPVTGRVHTDYNQTVAATGRLSSSNPNLQNIPIRTELGQPIRKAFIAEKGNKLVAADYSQFELRIVASLSGDEKMIASFRKGEDIHARTAAEINGIPIDKVTKQMRYAAKEVNFGVMYGMGAWGLAARTGLSRDEAKTFIEKYFALYKGIAAYLETTKELARTQGYVETLFGRRRYLPEIGSSMAAVRAAAERMAVNLPIQGTQADLIKLAMIRIHKELPTVCPEAKMLMQVHDELVFEVPAAEAQRVAMFVHREMEAVEKLKVPIVAEVRIGDNWGEMEDA